MTRRGQTLGVNFFYHGWEHGLKDTEGYTELRLYGGGRGRHGKTRSYCWVEFGGLGASISIDSYIINTFPNTPNLSTESGCLRPGLKWLLAPGQGLSGPCGGDGAGLEQKSRLFERKAGIAYFFCRQKILELLYSKELPGLRAKVWGNVNTFMVFVPLCEMYWLSCINIQGISLQFCPYHDHAHGSLGGFNQEFR
jgi:hypothetical protein